MTLIRRATLAGLAGVALTLAAPAAAALAADAQYTGVTVHGAGFRDTCDGTTVVIVANGSSSTPIKVRINNDKTTDFTVAPDAISGSITTTPKNGRVKLVLISGNGEFPKGKEIHEYVRPSSCNNPTPTATKTPTAKPTTKATPTATKSPTTAPVAATGPQLPVTGAVTGTMLTVGMLSILIGATAILISRRRRRGQVDQVTFQA